VKSLSMAKSELTYYNGQVLAIAKKLVRTDQYRSPTKYGLLLEQLRVAKERQRHYRQVVAELEERNGNKTDR
jgi:hypothetical protein